MKKKKKMMLMMFRMVTAVGLREGRGISISH
jgi:hypothetical protein